MDRFKSIRQAQRFLAAHDQTNTMFRPRRFRLSTVSFRLDPVEFDRLCDKSNWVIRLVKPLAEIPAPMGFTFS